MSHHKHSYLVHPDDDLDLSLDKWVDADKWINGCATIWDKKEAFAFAKLGATNCQFPFVVVEHPCGGEAPAEYTAWVIGKRYSNRRRVKVY